MSGCKVLTIGSGNKHVFIQADSRQVKFDQNRFGLVLTSPPFFHPERKRSPHGITPSTDLDEYADRVSAILARTATGLKGGRFICFVKTDVWHKGSLIPVGFRIMDECTRRGLQLRAHWIWERFSHYSPYSPSFANIFLLSGDSAPRLRSRGIFSDVRFRRRPKLPNSYTPEIFKALISLLTGSGDVVLDPFAGVGSVIEAASSVGRWCVGIEISRRQADLARKHLAQIVPRIVFRTHVCDSGETTGEEGLNTHGG